MLGEDYIRTARAKGLSERRVTYRHGLRSALTPVVTLLGIDLGGLLGGAIVTERSSGSAASARRPSRPSSWATCPSSSVP